MAEPGSTDSTPKRRRAPPAEIWRPIFITALRNSGNIRAACQAAGVDRTTPYAAREHSPEFRAQWDAAIEDACDLLEAKAWQRASSGESDTLLIFLLKSHRPSVYRDTVRVDITQALRQGALAMGLDPDEAVRAAEAILAGK